MSTIKVLELESPEALIVVHVEDCRVLNPASLTGFDDRIISMH